MIDAAFLITAALQASYLCHINRELLSDTAGTEKPFPLMQGDMGFDLFSRGALLLPGAYIQTPGVVADEGDDTFSRYSSSQRGGKMLALDKPTFLPVLRSNNHKSVQLMSKHLPIGRKRGAHIRYAEFRFLTACVCLPQAEPAIS